MNSRESKSDWIEDKCPDCDGTGTDKTKTHAPGGVSAAICPTCCGDGRKRKQSN